MRLMLRAGLAATTWNVSGVVSVMPRVPSPGGKVYTMAGVGFEADGLMRLRLLDVTDVNTMDPQGRTARFSNQVPTGAS